MICHILQMEERRKREYDSGNSSHVITLSQASRTSPSTAVLLPPCSHMMLPSVSSVGIQHFNRALPLGFAFYANVNDDNTYSRCKDCTAFARSRSTPDPRW